MKITPNLFYIKTIFKYLKSHSIKKEFILKQNQTEILKLQKANEDLNKFNSILLSNISHEIRTPLNAIIGYSEILNLTQNSQEKIKLIDNIKNNTNQLTQIIDNILEISKLESGQTKMNTMPQLSSTIITSIDNFLQLKVESKNIKYKINSQENFPKCLELDFFRLKQILLNLIDNSIKFSENVEITIKFEYSFAAKELIITITDKGIGISPDLQTDLFKKFNQFDNVHSRRYGGIGLGLGLSLSQRLANEMNGRLILVNSHVNFGSTFQLNVPSQIVKSEYCKKCKNENCVNNAIKNTHSKKSLKNLTVLLVEDSIDNQEIFKFYLNSAEIKVEIAADGESAIENTKHKYYDFILMDIQLPLMNGLEATRIIRNQGYSNPIIALTAHASIEEKLNCIKSGCVDLITKPVTQQTLIQQIQYILDAQ